MNCYSYLGLRLKTKKSLNNFMQFILRSGYYNSQNYYSKVISDNKSNTNSSRLRKRLKDVNKDFVERGALPVSFLETFGNGAYGMPNCLHASISDKGYLFNCGEASECSAGKTTGHYTSSAIFITSNSLKNTAGLKSFLFMRELTVNKPITLYGPPGLGPLSYEIVSGLSSSQMIYLPVKNQKINLKESIVQAVAIFSSNAEKEYAVAYICKLLPTEGILTVQSFIEAGVPPGPWIKQLHQGENVTLPDGTEVNASQLKREGRYKATTFIVIDIPSTSYLDSLLSCEDFHPHQAGSGKLDEDVPELIVHFTSPHVMKDPRYQQWANAFSPFVSHFVLNESSSLKDVCRPTPLRLRLNHLLPDVFPTDQDSNISSVEDEDENETSNGFLNQQIFPNEYGFNGPTRQSNMLLRYYFRPNENFKCESDKRVDPKEAIESRFYKDPEVKTAIHCMRSKFEQLRAQQLQKSPRPYPRVLFLGTGSPPASMTRANSAIVVHSDANSCFLMDCGDGTFCQMVRSMGLQKTEAMLRQLKLIYISHHHLDHHGGVATVLRERQKAFIKSGQRLRRLFVMIPDEHVLHYLSVMQKLSDEPIFEEVDIVYNFDVMINKSSYSTKQEIYNSLGLRNIDLCFVRHVTNSYGIVISHKSGWKLTYSGDTMPSPNLQEIGKNCDLLIHEASFEDDLADLAFQRHHSTVSQAIASGKKMNARFTLLTHFSRRYMEVPVIEKCPDDVGIAFDNMMVTLDDLQYLPHLHPVFKEAFYETRGQMKLKSKLETLL